MKGVIRMIKVLLWYAIGSFGFILVSFLYMCIYATVKLPDSKVFASMLDSALKKVMGLIPDACLYSSGFVRVLLGIFHILMLPFYLTILFVHTLRQIDAYEKPKEEA